MKAVKKTCSLIGDSGFLLPFELDREDRARTLRDVIFQETEKAVLTEHHRFLCGFTAGVDLIFAETVLELRRKYPDIALESVLAYENEAASWDECTREHYYRLLGYCDKEHLLQTQFSANCLVKRNRYLVDHADSLLTVSDGLLGNPAQAIQYASVQGKHVVRISPSTLAIQKIS
ncbi:MAG: SLOG family protein [Ethanoligenens sp.]